MVLIFLTSALSVFKDMKVLHFETVVKGNRQGSGCEKLMSHLTEMISTVLYTFEHGDSDSKMGPKIFCFSVM